MNSSPESNDTPNMSQSELISALDYEIESKEKALTMSGWTKWTFYGGFGTMVWVATEEMAKATFSIYNIILFFLLCLLVFDAIEMTTELFRPNTEKPSKNPNRIRIPSQHYPWARATIFADMMKNGVMIGAYFFLAAFPLGFWPRWFVSLFLGFYGLFVLMGIAGFIRHCTDRPIPSALEKPETRTIFKIVTYLIIFSAFAAILGLLAINFLECRKSFCVSDYRLGMLLAAFVWLFPIWIRFTTQYQPLLERLKAVRTDLAFQKIDMQTALRQADDALIGLEAKKSKFRI